MNHVAMAPTDEQLDRDWQPNGRRPQSTIARSFSQELIDIFRIEDSVSDLGKDNKSAEDAELESKLEQKKQEVTSQSSELEALERRIKEMEERLRRSQGITLPAGQNQGDQAAAHDKDSAQQRTMGTSRPGTAKQTQHAPMHGGAMPPTPTASEDGGDRDS